MTKNKRKIEEIEATVKPFGNTCHVTVPREWLGETVVVRLKETIRTVTKETLLDTMVKRYGMKREDAEELYNKSNEEQIRHLKKKYNI